MAEFMMLVLIVASVGGISLVLNNLIEYGHPLGRVRLSKKLRGLSTPARVLINEFNSLPAQSRPAWDIESLVRDMDKKYSLDNIEDHFGRTTTWRNTGRFLNGCPGLKTRYSAPLCDYHKLHKAMADVIDSLEKVERAELEAMTSHTAEDVRQLIDTLRDESVLNHGTAIKLKELS